MFLLSFFVILLTTIEAKNFEIGLESLSCTFDDTTCSNQKCYVKLVPFKNGLLNSGCRLTNLTTELWFQFSLTYYAGFIKQKLLDVNDNVCHYFRGKIGNPVVAGILTALYYMDPRKMHPCPYTGDLSVTDLDLDTLTKLLPGIFPSGKYVLNLDLRNENNVTFSKTKISFLIRPRPECVANS